MRYRTFGAAVLLAAAGATAAIVAAPLAPADSCDPAVAVCDGSAPADPNSGPMDFSPVVQPPADDYPADGDWFYSSPGPNEPAYGNNGPVGGGGHGGGGGHR